MATDISEPMPGRVHTSITPESEGMDFKKYNLTGIEVDSVDNDVIISCRYKMKPDLEAKAEKAANSGLDYNQRYQSERHVFEDMSKATAFVEARMSGKDHKPDAVKPSKSTATVKVTRG